MQTTYQRPAGVAKTGPVPVDLLIRMVNCAMCRCGLLGESMRFFVEHRPRALGDYAQFELVATRRNGRPYCGECARRAGW